MGARASQAQYYMQCVICYSEWSRGMLKLSKFGSDVKHLNYGLENALASGRDRFQYEP